MAMQYSDIKRHIIDRNSFWKYSIVLLLFLIYLSFIYMTEEGFSFLFVIILTAFICILLISNMLINLYKCRRFYKFYKNYLDEQTTQLYKVSIEKEDYQMRVIGRDTKVHSMTKPTNVISIETDDFLLLFLSIKYFGVFQQVLKPFIFLKTDTDICINEKSANVIKSYETDETEQGRTIVFPNRYNIKKVIIPR